MGLRTGDLKFCVERTLEIDSYKSKMGEDKDIVTISFAVNGEQPAEDLVKFIESGYDFVLDADKTSGEQSDGKFRVFVELERSKKIPASILEIVDGVGKNAARCIELASGAEHTEEELKATLKSKINPECPALANPNYVPFQ